MTQSALQRESKPPTTEKPDPERTSANLSLSASLVAEAEALSVDLSKAAEAGIAAEVSRRRQERWIEENREAMDSSNAYFEKYGLPLAKHRKF